MEWETPRARSAASCWLGWSICPSPGEIETTGTDPNASWQGQLPPRTTGWFVAAAAAIRISWMRFTAHKNALEMMQIGRRGIELERTRGCGNPAISCFGRHAGTGVRH